MKKFFNQGNVLLLLLVGLIGHNIFLQFRVENAIEASENAAYEARHAKNYAEEAASYASDAADYASDAANYASDASENAFGNNCRFCP